METSEGRVVPLTILITTPGEFGEMVTMLLTCVKTFISKVSLSFFKPMGFVRPNDSKVHSLVYLTGSFGVHDVLSYFPY